MLFFFFLYYYFFNFEDNCSTVLCWFLLYISMNQPQVHICLLQFLYSFLNILDFIAVFLRDLKCVFLLFPYPAVFYTLLSVFVFGCARPLLLHGLFSSCGKWGLLLWWLILLQNTGFSSCCTWAQQLTVPGLQSAG